MQTLIDALDALATQNADLQYIPHGQTATTLGKEIKNVAARLGVSASR